MSSIRGYLLSKQVLPHFHHEFFSHISTSIDREDPT
jgi:hypothetical protein